MISLPHGYFPHQCETDCESFVNVKAAVLTTRHTVTSCIVLPFFFVKSGNGRKQVAVSMSQQSDSARVSSGTALEIYLRVSKETE